MIRRRSGGGLPPAVAPSGAGRALGTRLLPLVTLTRVPPQRGGASADGEWHLTVQPWGTLEATTRRPPSRGGDRDGRGTRPHTRAQRTGHGHDDLRRRLAPGTALPSACAQPGLGLPPAVLERLGALLQAALPGSAHGGRVARRPGLCDQDPPGRGLPRLRETSLASALATGLFRRCQAQVMPEGSRVIHAGPVLACGEAGDRPRQRHATEGLERFHDGLEPPGLDVCVAGWCQPRAPFGVCGHRPPLGWTDAGRRWGGTPDRAAPAPGRGAPGGPAGIPALLPEHKGVAAQLGRLHSGERLCTRTAQGTHGCVCDWGAIDRGESPCAHQPGPWDGIPTSGGDAVARLLGDHGGGDAPAVVALWGQLAGAPGPPGARVRDEDQGCGV